MLGVKDPGRAPMAWSIRPGFRGDLNLVRRRVEPREGSDRVRIRYEPARRCTESCAACSVACLAWKCVKRRPDSRRYGHSSCCHRFWKPFLQKRLRLRNIPLWKTPRLSEKGRQGIAVRTKWQSGTHYHGDTWAEGSNGNGLCGNGRFPPVKNNPT